MPVFSHQKTQIHCSYRCLERKKEAIAFYVRVECVDKHLPAAIHSSFMISKNIGKYPGLVFVRFKDHNLNTNCVLKEDTR